MPIIDLITSSGLGSLLGMRHALEPDHLTAVSTLVSEGHTTRRAALLVGAVHGLAGSGALTALVLATLPTTSARLSYILLFGLGSTLGMAALSGLLGWPLARAGNRRGLARGVSFAVGCVSIALGIFW